MGAMTAFPSMTAAVSSIALAVNASVVMEAGAWV